MRCGYHIEDHLKYQVEKSNGYKSLFYFYVRMTESEVRNAVDKIFSDPSCGSVHRIKGFVKLDDQNWLQINAVSDQKELEIRDSGREAVIVIGEDLGKLAVDRYFMEHSRYHGEL